MKFSHLDSIPFASSRRSQAGVVCLRATSALALGLAVSVSNLVLANAQTAMSAPPAKVMLRFKAEAGQTARLQHVAVVTIAANGQAMKVNIAEVDKVKYIAADAGTGNVTLESRTESNKVTFGDGSAPPGQESKNDVETMVANSKGVLLSYKTTGEEDPEGESTRIGQATTIVLPDGPVTVGDKWSYDYKPDPKLKTHAAHGDFEIIGAVKVAGVTAFKIKMTYKEAGAAPMGGTGTHVIEIASGDEISSESSLSGMDVGGQKATATVKAKRLEGGPLASSKNGA